MFVAQYLNLVTAGNYFKLWVLFFDDLEMIIIRPP